MQGDPLSVRLSRAICAAFIIYTVVRLLLVVLSNPPIAYPNNGDFAREQACYGIWNDSGPGRDSKAVDQGHPLRFLSYSGEISRSWCAFSSDNVFLKTVSLFYKVGDKIDSRTIGLMKAATLVASVLVCMMLARGNEIRLLIAISFAVIFGDIGYLMYLRTLYSDFTAVASAYLVGIGCLVYCRTISGKSAVFVAVFMVVLGMSKHQYLPFAILAAAFMAWVAFRKGPGARDALIFAAVAVVFPAIFLLTSHQKNDVNEQSSRSNTFDTVMGALLPASDDKAAALRILKLPESCRDVIGRVWYEGNIQVEMPCREVLNVSRLDMLRLLVRQPETFLIPMRKAMETIHRFDLPDYSWKVCNGNGVCASLRYRFLSRTSLSYYLDMLKAEGAANMNGGIVLGGLTLAAILVWRKRHGEAIAAAYASGLCLYTIMSSVFGDGYFEIEKHGMGVFVSLGMLLGCLICIAYKAASNFLKINPVAIAPAQSSRG